MALTYSVNNTPATGAVAMYLLKTLLKSAGWTVPKSSDGTTYNSSGDQITGGGAGANGWANNSAWAVVQMPSSSRSFSIQRNAAGNNTTWRIVYSPSVGFTSGSPGATQVPAASDEVIILGGGTDAAPSFASLFTADGGYRWECASDAASPFGFWAFAFPIGSSAANNCTTGFFLDAMQTGTSVSSDTDPYVVCAAGGGSGPLGGNFTTNLKGMNANTSLIVACTVTNSPANPTTGWTTDPANGKVVMRNIDYSFSSSIYKGISKYFLWDTRQGDLTPTPQTLVTTNDKMTTGWVIVDWNGTTITI